jgi:octaprenyl-diphosphate synthase
MRNAAPSQRDLVTHAVREGGGDFAAVARIVTDNGSLVYSAAAAAREAALGRDALQALPPSVYRDSLLNLLAFAVGRDR